MTNSQTPAPLVACTGNAPRIYVACLAAYNSGRLHGVWIAADKGENYISDAVSSMLKASPEPRAEEWAIHDYEGFKGVNIAESASFETVCTLAEFILERGELGAKLLSHFAGDLVQARSVFDDYAGVFQSVADFAETLHEDIGTPIPETVRHYINWSALGRDMELRGDIFTIETGFEQIHIFWGC